MREYWLAQMKEIGQGKPSEKGVLKGVWLKRPFISGVDFEIFKKVCNFAARECLSL
jgi:hypothetical protein